MILIILYNQVLNVVEEKKIPIERSEIMQLKLADIYDNADNVSSDRKKQTLSIKCISEGYAITIDIKKVDPDGDKELQIDDISELEKKVLEKISEGEKQVQIAKDLGISQATVSGIKAKYPSLLELIGKSASESILSSLFEKKTKLQSLRDVDLKEKTIEQIIAKTSENKKK